MSRFVTGGRLLALGLVLLGIAIVAAVYPSNEYIFLPDRAHPVAPLVTVQGARPTGPGGIYFVDVVVRKATLLERLFGGLHTGADLYPANAVNPPGVNDALRAKIDAEDMKLSQLTAAAVALRALHRKVTIVPVGVRVYAVEPGMPAVGKLAPDDVITAVNGVRITTPIALFQQMAKRKPGDLVRFTVLRAGHLRLVSIKTVAEGTRAIVGVLPEPAVDIHLPLKVSIDAGNVGGPSAGLAFALEIMEKLGQNVDHGLKIAATGELFANGAVGPIGGIKQKTFGAREAGVDAFVVPAGENARDARKYAHGLRIIPVNTFQQALQALKTLRRKA